ncbi:MAG: CRISPR-associated endonuclease Cas2 [bacterium]|nr:CRISPR-associated endonuclease Cas2 [bacterium]
MKINISEQFLWGLYNVAEKISDINDIFRIKTFNQIISDQSFWRNLEKKKSRKQFGQFINYLKKKGYIETNPQKGIILTKAGEEKVLKIKYKFAERKRREDGQWIMLMYDIPSNRNKERHLLRRDILNLGFQQLQKSIWVCPFDILKETEEITDFLHLSKFIRIFLIKEVKI